MNSFIVVVPILEGKLDLWKANSNAFKDSAKMQSLMKEVGCTRVRGWSAKAADGSDVAVVLHEGPELSPEAFMGKVFGSSDPEIQALLKKNEEVHGPTRPDAPPPLGTLVFDMGDD